MFKNISNQTKIIIPTIVLSIVISIILIFSLKPIITKISNLQLIKQYVTYTTLVSSLLDSTQKERGLSYIYTINYTDKLKTLLIKQRQITDNKIEQLNYLKYKTTNQQLKNTIEKNLKDIQKITIYRENIDKYKISPENVLQLYSKIDEHLLLSIRLTFQYSNIPEISQNILALTNFLYMQENMGLLRAKSSILISKANSIHHLTQSSLIEIQSKVTEYEKNFLAFAKDEFKHRYLQLLNSKDYQKFLSIQQQILTGKNININSIEWFNIVTKNINNLHNISNIIKFDINNIIDKTIKDSKNNFEYITTLTILIIIIFIFMIIAFLKLANDEQRLRNVTDKYIITSITDTKGRIIDASQAFCDISGYTKKELIGKPHNIVRHPDMPKSVFADLWDKISKGQSWSGKVKNKTKDGGYYWVYANVEPLYDKRGELDSFISIRLDITDSEKLQEKIKQEEEKNKITQELMQQQSRLAQMGEMLSMIAHQWRQPLSAITATTSSLELKAQMGKLQLKDIEQSTQKIHQLAQHLSATIDDFRNFFKPNKEKSMINFENIIHSVQNIVESTIINNNIKINIEKHNIVDFYTYEGELKQVILNLVKNAEDALLENDIKNPTIDIIIDGTTLTIQDNAGGIPEDIMDKIFDPYFSTKLKKDGTGLGLYMSKTIIEEHCNGTLSVVNQNDGARFTITLPTT